MTDKNKSGFDVDDLLRRALADDLPADVAGGMRRRIERFRAGATEKSAPAAAWAWLFRRSVWAALAVLMLVAGFLLQGARSRSPLADRISELKAAAVDFETPRS